MHTPTTTDAALLRPTGFAGGAVYLLSGLLSLGLIWSYATEIDLVVRAQGVVRPEGDLVRVTTVAEGKVEIVYVEEGDELGRGDAILQLEDRENLAERWMLEGQAGLLKSQLRNIERKFDDNARVRGIETLKLEAEIETVRRDLGHRRTEHDAMQRSAEIQLTRAQEGYAISRSLFAAGLISRQTHDHSLTDLLLAETTRADLAGRTPHDFVLEGITQQRQLIDAQFQLRQRELASEAAPIEARLLELHFELERVRSERAHHTIRSPVNGRLTLFPALHPGETIAAGTLVAMLVPQSATTVVEVFVPNHDAGDVRPGQPVRLILKDFSAINGVVLSVSPDARFNDTVSGAHRVTIAPEKDDLLLGSSLDVRFIVGRERLLLLLVTRMTRGFRNWTGG